VCVESGRPNGGDRSHVCTRAFPRPRPRQSR
jgi:hypothetical protein